MGLSVETEKTYGTKDRKIARISAAAAFLLLVTTLCLLVYRIPAVPAPKQSADQEMTLIPLDPQILEQGRAGSQSGTPAKTEKTQTTLPQMTQMLAQNSSDVHVKSGNSEITNTNTPNNNPSGTRYVSENLFGTGGINGGSSFGRNQIGTDATKDESGFHSGEKAKRYLVEQPHTQALQSDENCKIMLSVLVSPVGNIIGSPTLVKDGSTTNNSTLISQVISAVKNQAQFNQVTATGNTKEVITIRINAH